jgi:hypothetical protein
MLDIGLWLADVSSGANCETGSAVAAWPVFFVGIMGTLLLAASLRRAACSACLRLPRHSLGGEG